MRVSAAVSPAELAAATPGYSGAQIEYTCRDAGLICIKESLHNATAPESVEIQPQHFQQAIRSIHPPSGVKSRAVAGTARAAVRN
jgi:SpoVK/Ycf46/Vps4 family AAA+-type ATPase